MEKRVEVSFPADPDQIAGEKFGGEDVRAIRRAAIMFAMRGAECDWYPIVLNGVEVGRVRVVAVSAQQWDVTTERFREVEVAP
jgi:hypothetical protein